MSLKLQIVIAADGTAAITALEGVGNKVEGVGTKAKQAGKDLGEGIGGISEQLERMQKFALGFVAFEKLSEYAGKAIEFADSWTRINGQMLVATGSTSEAANATAQLYQMAQKLHMPLEDTTKLFARLMPALKDYGGGTAESLRLTEALGLSLKINNATTAESQAAMLQFSQAMGAGVLRGEEFNSMLDAAPTFLHALADGLGVPFGSLKSMAEQGKLTTDVVYEMASKALPKLQETASKLPTTVGSAWNNVTNAAMKAIGEFDKSTGVSAALANALISLSGNMPALIDGITRIAEVTAAYFLVVKGGPIVFEAAKLAMFAFGEAQALFSLATEKNIKLWDVLKINLSNSPSAFEAAATGMDKLKLGGQLLAAFFIGWEIGSWLYENFSWAREAGLAFVSSMLKGWEYLKFGALAAWEGIKFGFQGVGDFIRKVWAEEIDFIAKAAEKVGATGLADKLKGWSDGLKESSTSSEKLKLRLNELAGARDKEIKLIDDTVTDMFADEEKRGDVTNGIKNQKAAMDKLNTAGQQSAKQNKDMQDTYDRFTKKLTEHNDELKASIDGHKGLTDTQKTAIQVTEFLNGAGQKLTQTQKDNLAQLIKQGNQYEATNTVMTNTEGKYKSLQSAIESQILKLTEQLTTHKNLTDTQKIAAQVTDLLTKAGINLTAAQRDLMEKSVASMTAIQAQVDAEEKATKIREEHTKKLDEGIKSLQESIIKADEERLSIGKTEAQVRQLAIARDKETLAALESQQARDGCSEALDSEIEKMKKRIALEEELDGKLTTNKGLKDQVEQINANTQAWSKFADDIGKDFTDGFQRMLENGKSGWDSFTSSIRNTFQKELVQWLYNAFAKPIVVNLVASMSGSANAATGGSIPGLPINGFSGLSSLGSLLNGTTGLFGKVGAIAQGLGSGISSVGSFFGSTGLQGFGGGLSTGISNGTFAANMGTMAGKALPVVGGYMIGNGINRAISGDYKVSNGFNTLEKVGTAVASAFFGPIGGAIAGAVGGVINRAFGMGSKNTESYGIQGTFSGDNFSGQNYTNWKQKGGWFRHDKSGTDTSALDSSTDSSLDNGFSALKQSFAGYATSLGLATNTISSYSKQIKLEFTDDQAANQQKITDLFNGMADEMASGLIPNLSRFSVEGETASATLQRLASTFDVTNATASLLGANFETAFSGIGLSSANARQALIDFSGGIDAFSQKVGFYYDNFYTDQEKTARAFAELDAKFDKLGINVSLDKGAFRSEMEKVNLAQAPEKYAALLDIAPLFTQVLQAMGDSAKGQSIGVGVNATGLSDKQLADINQSADSWFQNYQPQLKAQTDEAAKTTDAIVNLTSVSAATGEAIRAAIADGNTQLGQIIQSIQSSGMNSAAQSEAIERVLSSLGRSMGTSVATAMASSERL